MFKANSSCDTGEKTVYFKRVNTRDLTFSGSYFYESTTIVESTNDCCINCAGDTFCWLFDYNILTKECAFFKKYLNARPNPLVFLVDDINHVAGYYI